MNGWTIDSSRPDRNRSTFGSPGFLERKRGMTVELLLGDFRLPGFIEYNDNGDYFMAKKGQSVCGLYAGMKVYLAHAQVAVPLSI